MESSFKTVTLSGKVFAIGLFWQLLTKNSKGEIDELAKQIDFDLYAEDAYIDVHQVGFTSLKEGGVINTPSLALQILSIYRQKNTTKNKPLFSLEKNTEVGQPKTNLIAAIETGTDAWYWLVIREGVIQPDTDITCTQDELIERLMSCLKADVWQAVYLDKALEALDLGKAQYIEFEKLLSSRPSSGTKLKEVRTKEDAKKTKFIAAGIFIATIISLSIGYYAWELYQEKIFLEEQERIRAQKPPPPPPPPWDTQPLALDFVKNCLKYYTPILIGGWELQEFECSNNTVKHAWARNDGNLSALYNSDSSIVIDPTNQKATHSQSIAPLPGPGKHMEKQFNILQNQYIEITSQMQSIDGVRVSFKPQTDAPPAEGVQKKIKQAEFEILLSDIDPRFFISTMPLGTRIHSVQSKGDSWTIKGVLYGFDRAPN